MIDYYDRQGNPLTLDQWIALLETRSSEEREAYRRVAQTTVGQVWVSTVWLGLNHNYSSSPGAVPLIFETMAFGPGSWTELEADRYSTEAAALAGHERIVAIARKRHHGWVKHARDERRHAMKQHVALLAKPKRNEIEDALLDLNRLRSGRTRR